MAKQAKVTEGYEVVNPFYDTKNPGILIEKGKLPDEIAADADRVAHLQSLGIIVAAGAPAETPAE